MKYFTKPISFFILEGNKPIMFVAKTTAEELISAYPAGNLYISKVTGHHYLVANKNYSPSDIITRFDASVITDRPDRYTVQKNASEHIILEPHYLQYLNHSCDPNCYLDTDKLELIAIKPIREGETLDFFYPGTEWDMSESFQCLCQSSQCLGMIQGAKYISPEILIKYPLSTFIKSKIR
jgi:hypothetical protein